MKASLLFAASLALVSTVVHAAPSVSPNSKHINILNKCGHKLEIGYQTNDEPRGHIVPLQDGQTHTLTIQANWGGRIWARENCNVHSCDIAGAENPASLAEFKLSSILEDIDYYDVSFVDGYNYPIRIEPQIIKGLDQLVKLDKRHCRPSECTSLPTCPLDLQSLNGVGKFVACESACSKYGDDKYCCTGAFNTAGTCTSNHYAQRIKAQCPEAYSYAFDDATSVYGCKAAAYQVIFCP
ncbi:hypothetical protein [Parasitella parasitica]|uniref:Thaumatin-like protein n=1 Tax=Parasitella parasitica TaxID=35722 RepID=A0A0B7NRK7_9FUNG|nr:hypothetical protein [Parasitella parasitica]